jgi:enoyl-CoA hydratase
VTSVRLEREDAVRVVTLDRAPRRNALSLEMLVELARVCGGIADDTEARAVVFRGAGRDFSVGADLKDPALARAAEAPIGERRRLLQAGPDLIRAVQAMPQTTIVAIHGYCLGGAGCLALACDLRVASRDMSFGMPEVLRGMNMSWRTVPLMVSTFGVTRTKELLLTGANVEADAALVWGLANRVVDGGAEEATAEAKRWAHEIARKVPPLSATMIKETINAVAGAHTPIVHMDTDQYIVTQQTEDFAEAVAAFLGKREPEFKGR